MAKKFRKVEICPNCRTRIQGFNYCPNCGQINSHRQIHLKQILGDLLGEYFTFDSKFFRSFWPLISRPGFLTREYLSGRHATYILPLRLYIFTTFLFFLIISLTSSIDPYGTSNLQLQVNADTLKTFLQEYSHTINPATRERLAFDLDRQYSMLKKSPKERRSTFPDTLKSYLLEYQPSLNDTLAELYADRLYTDFDYYPKDASNSTSENEIKRMTQILNKMGLSEIAGTDFTSRLLSKYNFSKARYSNSNRSIMISFDEADSSGFAKTIQTKADLLFSQGKRGWAIFWNELIRQIPKIMFFLLPGFALFLKLFYYRQKILYINHLIFSLHVHSVLFIYLLVPAFFSNIWVILISLLAIWLHTFISFKNVYRQGWVLTFFKLNTLLLLYIIILLFAFLGLSLFTIWMS